MRTTGRKGARWGASTCPRARCQAAVVVCTVKLANHKLMWGTTRFDVCVVRKMVCGAGQAWGRAAGWNGAHWRANTRRRARSQAAVVVCAVKRTTLQKQHARECVGVNIAWVWPLAGVSSSQIVNGTLAPLASLAPPTSTAATRTFFSEHRPCDALSNPPRRDGDSDSCTLTHGVVRHSTPQLHGA